MREDLHYGFDNVLTDYEKELGRVGASETGAYAAVRAGGLVYEMVRRGRLGWHFSLMESSGAGVLCEFRPNRLREGGKLLGRSATVRLKHRIWSGNWTIAGLGPAPIGVFHPQRRTLRRRVAAKGPLQGSIEAGELLGKLDVSSQAPLPQTRETIPMLVFACWLIVQWESTPGAGAGGSYIGP
jgi:hypothetical protein